MSDVCIFQREYTGTEFGVLSVRVWYKQDTRTMLVEG